MSEVNYGSSAKSSDSKSVGANQGSSQVGRQGSQSGQSEQSSQSSEGGQLEQFVSYMKTNWKTLLTELVGAGVTAYLTHGKDNALKSNQSQQSTGSQSNQNRLS
jgi:hypothetical protein